MTATLVHLDGGQVDNCYVTLDMLVYHTATGGQDTGLFLLNKNAA